MISAKQPPVFLDRDGTLIVEKHYLSDPDQVCLEQGVLEGLGVLQDRGHPLIVVSNQSGIGRGKFTRMDAQRVTARLSEMLQAAGIEILAWYMCPHAPEDACDCRKPKPGMALAAARDWSVQLRGSYVIGDKVCDLELADSVGGFGLLVTTGHGSNATDWARAHSRPVFANLVEAAEFINDCDLETDDGAGLPRPVTSREYR